LALGDLEHGGELGLDGQQPLVVVDVVARCVGVAVADLPDEPLTGGQAEGDARARPDGADREKMAMT
jgi:hypothetical protein